MTSDYNSDSQRAHESIRRTKTANVGFVLLDSSLKLTYCNPEALKIFAYASTGGTTRPSSSEVETMVRSIIPDERWAEDPSVSVFLISGRRRYVCRLFRLPGDSNRPSKAITIERSLPRSLSLGG